VLRQNILLTECKKKNINKDLNLFFINTKRSCKEERRVPFDIEHSRVQIPLFAATEESSIFTNFFVFSTGEKMKKVFLSGLYANSIMPPSIKSDIFYYKSMEP
jgi:hypothetical protein